jgi:methylphosphotriester-DNA--protein-cysteine methyltransferase
MFRTYGNRVCLECGEEFTASKSNQIYCKIQCTRIASNKKIIERYHAAKALKSNIARTCSECKARLSRYNDDSICSPCEKGKKELGKIDLLRKLGFEYISED